MPVSKSANCLSKSYYRIGEVAALVGVKTHVIRYWEREFRSIRPTKSAKGHRIYSRRDVESLIRVRELLHEQGYTVAGARRRLFEHDEDAPALGTSAPRFRAREELLALRAEIEAFLLELETPS
ncbi:MAG: MerR family transcriptional regulator [Polyangiaceae bacterium]|jgi:DNA-binding transcriptional MerR regulator